MPERPLSETLDTLGLGVPESVINKACALEAENARLRKVYEAALRLASVVELLQSHAGTEGAFPGRYTVWEEDYLALEPRRNELVHAIGDAVREARDAS